MRRRSMFAHLLVHMVPSAFSEKEERSTRRALKQQLVADGIAHAALVYEGDRAVAWAEYGSPEELPNIHHRMEYLTNAERLPDYRVTASWSSAAFAVSRTRPAGTRSPLMMRDCWRCVRRSAIVGRRWRQRTGGRGTRPTASAVGVGCWPSPTTTRARRPPLTKPHSDEATFTEAGA